MAKKDIKSMLSLDTSIEVTNVEKEVEKKIAINKVYIRSNKKKVRCPKCNKFSDKIHDYLRPSKVLYLDIVGEKTYLIVTKRRFKCSNCNKSFTEDMGLTNKNGNTSLKVKQKILKDFLDKNKTIKDIARDNHVSEDTARSIFLEAMKNYPKCIDTLPEVISFDEKATYTSAGMYSFILNDPIHRVTLDILENRTKEFLVKYFMQVKNRKDVKVVITDLYQPYKEVMKVCFPKAILVADSFHYVRYVVDALDSVRLRLVHKYENNKKSYEYYMFKNRQNKGLLLKTFSETKYEQKKKEEREAMYNQGKIKNKPQDKFNDYWYGKIKIKRNNKFFEITRIDRLNEMLNLDKTLMIAYNLKEDFMRIITNVKYENAKKELKAWIKKCRDSNIDEMINVANTINNWLEEVVNSFLNDKYSNGFTEANNNVIDKIISVSYGYKNFDFFRLRTLAILQKGYSGGSRKNIEKSKIKK